MKSIKLFSVIMAFGFINAFADDFYPACYISGGSAHAEVCTNGSYSGNGAGSILIYDKNGELLDSSMAIWVGIAVMGCEEVSSTSVSDEAAWCVFQP